MSKNQMARIQIPLDESNLVIFRRFYSSNLVIFPKIILFLLLTRRKRRIISGSESETEKSAKKAESDGSGDEGKRERSNRFDIFII